MTREPHVVLVAPEYPLGSSWGGIASYTRVHAHALASLGIRVTVATGRHVVAGEAWDDSVRLVGAFDSPSAGDSVRAAQADAFLLRLAATDGFMAVEAPEYAALLRDYLLRPEREVVVTRLHGAYALLREYSSTGTERLVRRVLNQVLPNARIRAEMDSVRLADAAVSPSRWALEALRRRNWELPASTMVVPNPVPMQDGAGGGTGGVAPASVLFFGRLDRIKGADLYPETFMRIWRDEPRARIGVLGQDSQRSRGVSWAQWIDAALPANQRHLLQFHGGLPADEAAVVIDQYALVAFVSVFETFSYTLAECMARGRACVVASEGGAKELGANGDHFIRAIRSPGAVADATLWLMRNPGAAAALGRNASRHITQWCEPRAIARRMLDLYESLQYRSAARKRGAGA